MRSLAGRYPDYLWERNVGYSTLAHLQGLADHGVTPHHRRSFIPVQQLTLDLSAPLVDVAQLAAMLESSSDADPHFAGD
jgi:ribonuclease HII